MTSKYDFVPLPDVFTEKSRIPAGTDLYYECLICHAVIKSRPSDNLGCACGNVFADVDAFKLDVRDYSKFRILKKVKRNA